jgi:hypothetical protein
MEVEFISLPGQLLGYPLPSYKGTVLKLSSTLKMSQKSP